MAVGRYLGVPGPAWGGTEGASAGVSLSFNPNVPQIPHAPSDPGAAVVGDPAGLGHQGQELRFSLTRLRSSARAAEPESRAQGSRRRVPPPPPPGLGDFAQRATSRKRRRAAPHLPTLSPEGEISLFVLYLFKNKGGNLSLDAARGLMYPLRQRTGILLNSSQKISTFRERARLGSFPGASPWPCSAFLPLGQEAPVGTGHGSWQLVRRGLIPVVPLGGAPTPDDGGSVAWRLVLVVGLVVWQLPGPQFLHLESGEKKSSCLLRPESILHTISSQLSY